ncbi:MAG: anti-sigma regulatory factor [Verrucomicrobia bacterium]|nr:anti-sigma regulatory factor [Verrucomicrobiota bacterium]
MNELHQGEFRITSENDIVMARKVVRDAATTLGFGITDVTRIVTAASELTRNIYHYAKSGVMHWRSLNQDASVGLELTFEDSGPGIADLEKAMEMGFSTGKGLGMGLPGAKRLMDELVIESTVGKGTTVVVRKWLKK